MPGIHLNNTEKKLKRRWDSGFMPKGSLLGIEIHGEPGLRGLSNLELYFKYPVTVICGKNGTGKTTLLALAALGFHRIDGFHPKDAKHQVRNPEKGSYYTFSNFFYKGPTDSDCMGLNIRWVYKNHSDVKITKRSEKWMHYERRPARAVQYLGSSRILSAIEQKTLRSHFKEGKKVDKTSPLSEEYLKYLTSILGRTYSYANDLEHASYHLRTCKTESSYSSFNMGAGEDAIIELLSYIQKMPKGSLCIIEEIELGIHPEALAALAEVIQEIAEKKEIQFIISSHSSAFIDSLPRQARILLQRFGKESQVIYGPTTRFAMGTMSKTCEPDLYIYCEDLLAKKLLKKILPLELRKRVYISEIGGKSEFRKVYDYHQKTMAKMKCIFIWDGDVDNKEIETQFEDINFNYCFLHPSGTPEFNILQTLKQDGIEKLTQKLGCSSCEETNDFIKKLLTLADHHDFIYEASQSMNLSEEEVCNYFLDCYKEIAASQFENLVRLINSCLSLQNNEFLTEHNR